MALAASLTSAAAAAPQQLAAFDLDNGNAPMQVIYPILGPVTAAESFGRPMSWASDQHMLIEIPWFDAIAPYNATAKGIFSDLGRRPPEERTTRNRNIAVIYSTFTSLNAVFPQYRSKWLDMMNVAGLDPNVTAEDPATASGIGILAAKNALAARRHDGTNRYGDEGGRRYNLKPYSDFTGYQPVNTADELRNPSRWQPEVTSNGKVYTVQQFDTPQYGWVKPFTFRNPDQFRVSAPAINHHFNRAAYKDQTDQVLAASANLTETQKAMTEVFNDNGRLFAPIAATIVLGGRLDTQASVQYIVTSVISGVDVTIATWYYKRKFDAVRPSTAVRYLYGNKRLTAWGGPGKGTVNDISGSDWRSYLSPVASASPGYPSDVAANCLAYVQQARRFTGTDVMSVNIPVLKGSSLVEPGITPAADTVLHWGTLTDYASDCGKSRVWGGEEFPAAVAVATQYASQIGDLAYDFVQRKLNGG
ncbi:hypothetical protein OHA72_37220 [Dactylosporangium sp. NBC_01737]|uniref:DUF6851 domain-containing protein n=1 Tax=Dactylosporangium sp. NBC_01737 TaxID=2975959 RepID=UPI002E12024E|nr:hypothetical protein OHA72_37220 [Dactylosporangium sp. NBC_01737]